MQIVKKHSIESPYEAMSNVHEKNYLSILVHVDHVPSKTQFSKPETREIGMVMICTRSNLIKHPLLATTNGMTKEEALTIEKAIFLFLFLFAMVHMMAAYSSMSIEK